MNLITKDNEKYLHYGVLLILIYLVIFLKIDNFSMRWWDESMFAVNTYEMQNNHKWFSLYFDGKADLFNTKPPFTIWLQLIFVKLIGYTELALRLPSAISSCLTTLIIFTFIKSRFNYFLAWTSVLILLTSTGFIGFHSARTADSDAVLTLFIVLSNLYLFKFIEIQKKVFILLFFIYSFLAFSTKLYAVFLFLPSQLFIILYSKKFKSFVYNKTFIIGLIMSCILAFILIYLREIDTPGYALEILVNDSSRLYEDKNNPTGFMYFIDYLFGSLFNFWMLLAIIGGFFSLTDKTKTQTNYQLKVLVLFVIINLITISTLAFKRYWYVMPIMPFLSIVAAIPFYLLSKSQFLKSRLIQYLFLVICFIYPYSVMFNKSQAGMISKGEQLLEANEIYLFNAIKSNKNLDGIQILYHGWYGGLLFYKYKLHDKQEYINLTQDITSFKKNDLILVCQPNLKNKLKAKYELTEIDSYKTAVLYKIN